MPHRRIPVDIAIALRRGRYKPDKPRPWPEVARILNTTFGTNWHASSIESACRLHRSGKRMWRPRDNPSPPSTTL